MYTYVCIYRLSTDECVDVYVYSCVYIFISYVVLAFQSACSTPIPDQKQLKKAILVTYQ